MEDVPRQVRSAVRPRTGRDGLLSIVREAALEFAGLGPDFAPICSRLRGAAARLRSEEFRVAVVGQFKRGKSTLLNALLGEEVLPTAILPLTSVPTLLARSETRRIEIHPRDGRAPERLGFEGAGDLRAALEGCVTERENPENVKGVARVEVGHPAPVLSSGIVLVDTPGIGSTFRHNTRTTVDFLPECDAALFVVSPDPPLTEVEIEFLRTLEPGAVRLFVILNKIDTVNAGEAEDLVGFLRETLAREAALPDAQIACVSARDGLAARTAGDADAWRASGVAGVEERILRPLAGEKSRLLARAVRQKAADLVDAGLSRARLASRALTLPIEDLDARLATLKRRTEEVRTQEGLLRDLVGAERDRAFAFLEEQAADLRGRAGEHLRAALERAVAETGSEEGVRRELARAVPALFDGECARLTDTLRDQVAKSLSVHERRAEELVREVESAAEEVFEVPVRIPGSGNAFRMTKDLCWSTEECMTSLTPIPSAWIDALLPLAWREKRLRRRLAREVSWLVVRNVEALRWAARRSLGASVDGFLGEIRSRLGEVAAATEGAVARARTRRDHGAESVAEEVARLGGATERLAALRARLAPRG